jgi:outer membrane protein assembly factor BamB
LAGCGRSWVYDYKTPRPCTLEFKPQAISYGLVTVGAALTGRVDVWNAGDITCQVSQVALGAGSDPDFSLPAGQTTAFSLAPGKDASLYADFEAASLAPPPLKKGTLTFLTGDPANPTATVPLLASIQGEPGPYSAGWPKWHNDNTDQGQSAADTSADVGKLVWRFPVGPPQASVLTSSINPNPTYMNSPVVDAVGNVYQLGMDGTFYALNPQGQQLWTASLLPPNPDEHPATPIIAADGTIYVETGTDSLGAGTIAQLYHLDSRDGTILFEAGPPTGENCISTRRCETSLDCGGDASCDGGICCFTADGFDVNPSLGNSGLLFDGDDFGQIVTYSLEQDGSFTQANEVILEFIGERVAVALDENDNSFWCSANTCYGVTAPAAGFTQMSAWPAAGALASTASPSEIGTGVWVNSDLAYDKSFTGWLMVEVGIQIGNIGLTEVVAMDRTDGSLHWSVKLPFGFTPGSFDPQSEIGIFSSDVGNSAPAIDAYDGTVYVGNVDGLYALVGATGAIKAGFPVLTEADVDSAPAIGGDRTIFFGTSQGIFYAVNPDGTERYRFVTGGRISSSPAIGPDGTVFFVSDDGYLYALR